MTPTNRRIASRSKQTNTKRTVLHTATPNLTIHRRTFLAAHGHHWAADEKGRECESLRPWRR